MNKLDNVKSARSEVSRISEIFSSLQGEGPHMGEPHIFVRFEECNIHCAYCDELGKPAVSMGIDEVFSKILELEKSGGPHHFVSLTGGEPLLYVQFIDPLIDLLRQRGFPIYLETSGILPKALIQVVDRVDVVAMDIKLKSVTKEPRNYFDEHREFLRISNHAARSSGGRPLGSAAPRGRRREVFIKMIVSPEVDADEFLTGVRIIEAEDPQIVLVLQGVTSPDINENAQKDVLRELQKTALRFLPNVRIMPRLHIAMGIR